MDERTVVGNSRFRNGINVYQVVDRSGGSIRSSNDTRLLLIEAAVLSALQMTPGCC